MPTNKPNLKDIQNAGKRGRGRPKGSTNLNFDYKKKKREEEKAIKLAWEKGILDWKLDSNQMEMYKSYYNPGDWTTIPFLWGRQIGKTFCVITIIIEEAIKNPDIVMGYIGPKLNQVKKILKKKFREIQADCPNHLKAKFNSQDNVWIFPNGSELYVAGTDNGNAENIRGMTFERVFVDEFCFLTDFEYVMNSIIFI